MRRDPLPSDPAQRRQRSSHDENRAYRGVVAHRDESEPRRPGSELRNHMQPIRDALPTGRSSARRKLGNIVRIGLLYEVILGDVEPPARARG